MCPSSLTLLRGLFIAERTSGRPGQPGSKRVQRGDGTPLSRRVVVRHALAGLHVLLQTLAEMIPALLDLGQDILSHSGGPLVVLEVDGRTASKIGRAHV